MCQACYLMWLSHTRKVGRMCEHIFGRFTLFEHALFLPVIADLKHPNSKCQAYIHSKSTLKKSKVKADINKFQLKFLNEIHSFFMEIS
jgi:hypothetical protein